MVKTLVTKDMTEKDIMKVWVDEFDVGAPNSGGYTDAKWRAECEAKAKKLAEERIEKRKLEMQQELQQRYTKAQQANLKQIGGDHYKNMGVEPWDVVDTWPIEQQIGAHRKDALKYLMRMYDKNTPLENAAKALHCLEKLVEVMEQDWEEKHCE